MTKSSEAALSGENEVADKLRGLWMEIQRHKRSGVNPSGRPAQAIWDLINYTPQVLRVLDRMAEFEADAEAEARSEGAASGGEWRDIASAPKDGARVLVWCPADRQVFAAPYEHGLWQTGVWRSRQVSPTHWQPLPAPPPQGEA